MVFGRGLNTLGSWQVAGFGRSPAARDEGAGRCATAPTVSARCEAATHALTAEPPIVGSSDTDVVQSAGDAQGDGAGGVDDVFADAFVRLGRVAGIWGGLGQGVVVNRPGFRGGSQPTEDEGHGSTEEVSR